MPNRQSQMAKTLPALPETWVQSLGWENSLEKGRAIHSSILAWRIPRTEEPGGLQSRGLQTVRHNWATNTCTFLSPFLIIPMSVVNLMCRFSLIHVNSNRMFTLPPPSQALRGRLPFVVAPHPPCPRDSKPSTWQQSRAGQAEARSPVRRGLRGADPSKHAPGCPLGSNPSVP